MILALTIIDLLAVRSSDYQNGGFQWPPGGSSPNFRTQLPSGSWLIMIFTCWLPTARTGSPLTAFILWISSIKMRKNILHPSIKPAKCHILFIIWLRIYHPVPPCFYFFHPANNWGCPKKQTCPLNQLFRHHLLYSNCMRCSLKSITCT